MKKVILILLFYSFLAAQAQSQATETTEKDSIFKVDLGDVEVTAYRKNQRLSKGGLVTEVRNTSLSDAGTCRDVISQLPGVIADEGNIEILGRGKPLIYINGRRVLDLTEIDRLSSKEIRDIDVVFNPGPKYGGEVKSVILIRTLRQAGDGLSGSAQANMRLAHFASFGDNLDLNFRKGEVDVFGSFNYDFSRRFQRQYDITNIFSDNNKYCVKSDKELFPQSTSYLVNIGSNWKINNHSLGIKYDYNLIPGYKSHWIIKETVGINNTNDEIINYDTRWNGSLLPFHLLNLYYNGKLKSFNISINNDYLYRSDRQYQSIFQQMAGLDNLITSNSRIKNTMFASKGDVEYNFYKNTFEFGYELTLTNRKEVAINSGVNLPDTDDHIKELTCGGYVALNLPVGEVEFYAGTRYEHTISDYFHNGRYMEGQSRRYSRILPYFDFTFPLGEFRFTLGYDTKTKRPLYSQLSNAVQYNDYFMYETGNPFLKSEMLHKISLAGLFRWLFFSASYTYDKNAIIGVFRPYEDGQPQNVMTYDNFNHLIKYDVVVSLSPRILRWSPRLRLNLLGQHFSINTYKGIKNLNNPVFFFNFYNSVSLGKGFMATGDVIWRTGGDMDIVSLQKSWQINMGLSKSMKNWFFQLQATDLFKTARNSMITHGQNVELNKWNYSDSQAIRLIIRYSFNTTKKRYKGNGAGRDERSRFM